MGDVAEANCSAKCAKLGAALRGRTFEVELTATGTRDNNALDKLLRCECKERGVCKETLATYAACHGSVMSVGSYKGKSHCGPELAALRACVFGS